MKNIIIAYPYTLRYEVVEGITYYFVSFTDGQAVHRETEVSRPVFLEFLRFVKVDKSLQNWDDRHREQSEQSDETLNNRAFCPPKSVEDTIFDLMRDEKLRQVIQDLPDIQRRRFVLYHEFGLTYEQIAKMEGCTKMAIKFSVDCAEEKVKEKMKKFFEN